MCPKSLDQELSTDVSFVRIQELTRAKKLLNGPLSGIMHGLLESQIDLGSEYSKHNDV